MSDQKPPPTKRKKKVIRVAECNFMNFYKDCHSHIIFLQRVLTDPKLMDGTVLKYAAIYTLIRVGENLTFLRDDEKFSYKHEWEEYCKVGEKEEGLSISIDSITLSKPIGPAPTFVGTIPNCINALQAETYVLRSIPDSDEDSVLILAKNAAFLRCLQILDDLQKTKEIQTFLNPQLHASFDQMFDKAKEARERLAHVLSFSPTEISQKLLSEVNSDMFLQFVDAAKLRSQEIEKAKTMLPSKEQPKKMPVIVPMLKETVRKASTTRLLPSMPLSSADDELSESTHTITAGIPQASKSFTPMLKTVEFTSPLVDYESSDDEEKVDKQPKKEDTIKRIPSSSKKK